MSDEDMTNQIQCRKCKKMVDLKTVNVNWRLCEVCWAQLNEVIVNWLAGVEKS